MKQKLLDLKDKQINFCLEHTKIANALKENDMQLFEP